MSSLLSSTPRTPHPIPQETRTSSPSYFGLAVESNQGQVHSSSARAVKVAFSPTSAIVRSVAATPPQSLPLNSNPEYEGFRKASGQSSSFSLNSGSVSHFGAPSLSRHTSRSTVSRTTSRQALPSPRLKTTPIVLHTAETAAGDVKLPKSPKRLLSADSQSFFDRPRRHSPAVLVDDPESGENGSPPPKHEIKQPRLSLPSGDDYDSLSLLNNRAETLPGKLDNGSPNLATPQHIMNVLEAYDEQVLILDLRVSTQYARAHIAGALNLCIPTTLLKRSSYNVQKLAETFKDETQRSKFEQWAACKCIVVYDANSAQTKETASCTNILKKFVSDGWKGETYIVRGGFVEFSRKFPARIEQGSMMSAPNTPKFAPRLDYSNVPPVIGGCPIPLGLTKSAANPFFGNIRQNMDLIGGVGQMSIKHPSAMNEKLVYHLPAWLRNASDENDNGKEVSDKFLHIEKREQKRMQEALSSKVVYGSPGPEAAKKVQIAGIEKGAKNRYNNIWPYEHSRVKLEGVPSDGCDYVNANFVQTSLSNKKYIATQGPIPATFTDFWDMVWQRDIRVIVMLTAENEGGQVKAHNYWSDRHYGQLKLQFLSEHRASLELSKIQCHRKRPSLGSRRSQDSKLRFHQRTSNSDDSEKKSEPPSPASPNSDQPFVIVRRFTLSHESEPFERMREITQLQYSSWPDFGAPAHPAHLLGLVEQCDAVVTSSRTMSFRGSSFSGKNQSEPAPEEERPVLVHCSAGCGRTGTFCTVDSIVDVLKTQQKLRALRAADGTTPMEVDSGCSLDATKKQKKVDDENSFFGDGIESAVPGAKVKTVEDSLERDEVDLIEKTVEEFRLQRLSMVQSLRQFVLCYETVLEWIVAQQARD